METSTEMIRKVDQQLRWMAGLWFLWGIGFAVGKWLSIDALKADSISTVLWFGLAGLFGLGMMVRDCAKAVLAGIREHTNGNTVSSEDDPQAASDEDWADVWVSLPDWAKQQLQQTVEDNQLRRRAQDLNMWPMLWAATPEDTKEKLRRRWNTVDIKVSKTRTR